MATIREWAEANAKDGANFAELDDLIERSNPINGIKSKEDAELFIKGNDDFKSLFDSYVSKAVDAHDTKFKETKLPEILKSEKEKIRAELNPKESDEQKQIRELREELNSQRNSAQLADMKGALRAKGKELGVDESIAESFAAFGEDSETKLSGLAEYINTRVQAGVETEIKTKFKGRKAPGLGKPANGKVVGREAYDGMPPQEQSTFISDGGMVTDE